MEVLQIAHKSREASGKRETRELRSEGLVPGVVYSKNGVHHIALNALDMKPLIYTPEFKLAELNLEGGAAKCFVKDIQFHPVTDEIVHIDFQELVADRKVKVEVPVRFTGAAPGVRSGGKLIQKMRRIKIKCDPKNLVDHLVLDISSLELGSSVRVRDIADLEGVEIMNSGATPVASVEVPRALRSAESKKEAEATTPEEADVE